MAVGDAPLRSLRGVRVLVTGGSGFVGRWVVALLHRRQADLGLVVRDPNRVPVTGGRARVFRADLAEPGALAAVIAEWQPAVLFQLAGYGVAKDEREPRLMQRMNAELPVEAIEALAQCPRPDWPGLRMVHAGSAFEYGALAGPFEEAAVAMPVTAYAKSKLAGTSAVQRAARARRVPALVARLFTVFGPGERAGRLFPLLLAARAHEDAIALSSGEQQRDFILVWDVADALVDLASVRGDLALAGAEPFDHGVLNFASGSLHSVRDFVVTAAQALGIARERLSFGALPQLVEDTPLQPVPTGRLRRALGRALPGDLSDSMARVRDWLDRGTSASP